LVDVDTGIVSAAPYQGGRILYAPNGKQVIIYATDGLSLAKIDGSELKKNILPGYHGIGEGESYYHPRPFWSNDSSTLQVALPDQNEIYSHSATVSVWRIPVAGNPKKLSQWNAFAPSVHFSPDLAMMAYWPLPIGAANERELHLVQISSETAKKSEDVIYIRGELTADLAWSPDSQHFIYQMGDPDTPTSYYYLGGICQRPAIIKETTEGGAANWVDKTRFLLEIGIPDTADPVGNPTIPAQWELHLGRMGQDNTELLGVVTAYHWTIIP
jgi:hypothetical protein